MSVQTFSPEFVDIIISTGDINHIVTGFQDGSMVTIEPATERFTPTVGAKGEEYRAHQPSRAVSATIGLSQTSHSNDILFQLLENDRDTLDGTFTMTVKDSSGTTIYTDEFAYIQEEPSQAFSGGGTIEAREWTIRLPKPSYNIGGNGRFSVDNRNNLESIGGTVDSQWAPNN